MAFDGAVINTFNKNGDGINSTTAKKIKDYFINKPVNIEHQRQKVVGHIVGSYFTKKDDGSLINLDDSLSSDQEDPFHLSLSAVIYKIVNQDFAKLVEDSAEEKIILYINLFPQAGNSAIMIMLSQLEQATCLKTVI